MHDAVVRHPMPWLQGVTAWWRQAHDRERDLLRMAREVEREQPGLARELRGIAMHEAAVARRPARVDSWWRRTGRAVWQSLEEIGRARAERELRALADRWAATQPELAQQLRAACARRP